MSGQSTETKQSPQEVISKLREAHLEKVKLLADLKDKMNKVRDEIIDAQDAVFKTFQNLASTSEQYLVSVVESQNNQLKSNQTNAQNTTRDLPTIPESRADNLKA